ncbi:DUF1697 domain-containing protein [Sphingobacterium griseoflavum]|uniref:DUF1697 domain-containing protein n=1 Tax=Sphingobacterium griseoflavum TaxID=1474952 RepID=A0ABQ3HTC7_9SPHI|nr:DUF1697 domain-containing protein [Sphingobacterium griseoflavum]GHE31681.1 hypothetical protein GCM10017764_13520 [Sphingobacterium griseoflavum]
MRIENTLFTYVVLLRAVNVAGKNIIKMSDLRQELVHVGFQHVSTYIQSGNILLASSDTADLVRQKVQQLILDKFGLAIHTFVVDAEFIERALRTIPITGELLPNRLFITVLDKTPQQVLVDTLQTADHGSETFALVGNILYFYLPEGAAKAKLSNSYFEKKLQVTATGRNLNTYQKLLELAKNVG